LLQYKQITSRTEPSGEKPMKKMLTILIMSWLLSLCLMGTSPGRVGIINGTEDPPWPKEVNQGEPTMEKIFVNWGDLQIGSPTSINNSWSQPETSNGIYYFVKNNNLYYWFDFPSARFPKVGLCRWRYIYDSEHEW